MNSSGLLKYRSPFSAAPAVESIDVPPSYIKYCNAAKIASPIPATKSITGPSNTPPKLA